MELDGVVEEDLEAGKWLIASSDLRDYTCVTPPNIRQIF
jgi:hypothetical protein